MSEFMAAVAERAKLRDMNPLAFLKWRNELRQDYQQAFDPPPYKPKTAIGFGWMMPCLDGSARVSIGTRSREFYETPGAPL